MQKVSCSVYKVKIKMENENYIKLRLSTDNGWRSVYCILPKNFSDLVSAIKNNFVKENTDALSKYWIDDHADHIDIPNDESYQIFLVKATEKIIYLFKESNLMTIIQELTNSASNSPEKVVHVGITCDECEEYPIRGYRYMCIQCDNYDICMKCEAKMKHSEHIMIRLAHPIDSTFATKRLVRKIRRGIKLPQDEKFHSRRHHSGHGSVVNSIYTMMHDLADVDADISEEQPTASASPPEPNQSKKRETKQEKKPRCSPTSPRCPFAGEAETRRVEIPVIDIPAVHIDSEYIKAGVQVLSNFSQMFAKMLDPMESGAHGGSHKKDDKNEKKGNKDDKPEAPMEKECTQTSTAETNNSVNEDSTTMDTEAPKGNSSQDSGFQDPQPSTSRPIQSEGKESLTIEQEKSANMEDKKEGTPNEFDWTVINAPNARKRRESEPSSRSDPANPDYGRLMQQLHVEKEQESTSPTAPKPRVETQQHQIVYHKKRHIKDATNTMMSMGFSNEGQWLTRLLGSVNGNIERALDLLRPEGWKHRSRFNSFVTSFKWKNSMEKSKQMT